MVQRLAIISMSITNVVRALRCELGVDPAEVSFLRPVPLDAFDAAWSHSVGILNSSLDTVVAVEPEHLLSHPEIRAILERRGQTRSERVD